jgi:hypothetical protein
VWWHVDLCEDQRPASLDKDQKTKTPGKILAGDSHKTPGKILAGDGGETPARPLPRASAGPRPGPYLPTFCCPTAVPMRRPARQLGEQLCGSMQLLSQLAKHLRGGRQIFVKALSPHQHSSQPVSMALHASSAWTRVEARRGGDGRDGLCCRPR